MSAFYTSPGGGVPLLVVISGPSGVGKDAVIERMKLLGVPYYFAVTATGRPRRENEVDGVDYLFMEREYLRQMAGHDELLESAEVYGNPYGVPKSQVRAALAQGQDVILKIDVQGAANIRQLVPGAVCVFLKPPDMTELRRRLKQRGTESLTTLNIRLSTAQMEMEKASKFDYEVVNRTNRLDETVNRIISIIDCERARSGRMPIII